jgi:hypothetical protein
MLGASAAGASTCWSPRPACRGGPKSWHGHGCSGAYPRWRRPELLCIFRDVGERLLHNATPPDFNLLLLGDPQQWFNAVVSSLLAELNRHDPRLLDAFAPPVEA